MKWEVIASENRVSFFDDDNILKLTRDGCTAFRILKNIKWYNFHG